MIKVYPNWASALVELEDIVTLQATATMFAIAKQNGVDIENESECRPIIEKWLNDAKHKHKGARVALDLLSMNNVD